MMLARLLLGNLCEDDPPQPTTTPIKAATQIITSRRIGALA